MNQKTIIILITFLLIPGMGYALSTDELPKINSVAVHKGKIKQLFAATGKGVYSSVDNGLNWTDSGNFGLPATMVSEPVAGSLYAFVVGRGLLQFNDDSGQWQVLANQFGSQVLLQLSADAENPDSLIALNQYGKLIVSENAGKDWHSIKDPYKAASKAEERGLAIFRGNCLSCHGVAGVGETYTVQALTDKNYFRAPALNNSEHAWHHLDDSIVKTILEGSPRTKRMTAWKYKGFTEQNAEDLVAYIKSLWTQRELDCQGPKHTECM